MKNKNLLLHLFLGLSLFALAAAPRILMAQTDTSFSYDDWRQVLDEYVNDQGFVDYQGLSRSREGLDRFVDQIGRISPRSHPDLFPERASQLAYYLNTYNALVFHGVLREGHSVKSVWGFGGTGYGFFVGARYIIGGEELSLKKLEDEWIRAGFEDPRIHAALNCASIGCPRLPREPFSAQDLEQQLDAGIAEFVTNEAHCRLDAKKKTVTLSKIFPWYEQDFLDYERAQGTANPTLVDYINRYRPEDGQIPQDYKVKIFKYDKGLNRQP